MSRPAAPSVHAPCDAPPFWLPLLLALPLAAGLALLALPLLGYGPASASRTLFLTTLLLWLLPLTAVQRALWRRGLHPVSLLVLLLVATFAMALVTRAAYFALQPLLHGGGYRGLDGTTLLRGLEAPWLALAAYAALHAVLAYAWALRGERQRLAQAQALAREAELRALRLQLQPHFLFNALNAVSALVGDGRANDAQRVLARLADFLRATLEGAHADEVPLADELALTQAYLAVEQARMGERLQLHWSIGPGVMSARVPWLMLQPLVENAIRHGIAPRRDSGRVDIRVQGEGERLRVDVRNDLPPRRDAMASGGTHDAPLVSDAGTTGIGLGNLSARLDALHPGRHALRVGPDADGRWLVTVDLPLIAQAPP